jgi:prepilin-type N-terminal cleavage/methylation domain-containing protein
MKSKKGFTLFESMAAITVGSVAAMGAMKLSSDHFKEQEVNKISEEIAMVLEGVDLRLSNDGFMLNLWPVINSNYEFSNREQVVQFLSRSIIATNAPNCGATNGWIPVKDDPAEEDYKDSYQFMACGQWEENIGFDLNVSARLINDGNVVNGYEMDFFFDNEEDFQKSFLEFKKIYQKSRAKTEVSKTGSFDYNLVNRKTGDRISSIECLNMKDKSDCGIRAIYLGSDNSQDYLAVNGNNNMIGSKVKFQEDLTSTAISSCHRYELNAGIWERVDNVFCGIGIGLSDPTDLDSTPLNYVELNVESISTNKLFLDKKCNFEDNTGAIVEMPCGVYNEDSNTTPGVTTAIAVYDEVKADLAMIGVTNAGIANISEANISNALNVAGTSNFDGNVTVNGISDFNNVVNINGEETDVNLVVNTSASLKDVDILGALNVDGIAIFEQDVDVKGDLVVDNKIEANQITLTNKISSSNLGQKCNVEDGTIVQYESAGYTDLAICANQKWKLVNIQENQIMAFDGSCPSGFEKFSKAEGRTLIGAGNLYDSDSGQTMSYSVGQVGGKAKHTLSINEMPSHSHDFRDAYWAEHWGDTGAKNKAGSHGGQDHDNNYYTRAATTEAVGGGQSHENRMPYYVVNWCIYKG